MAAGGRVSFLEKPKLRDLFTIKLENWFTVGKNLGFKEEELIAIQTMCQVGGDRECQKRMLARWKYKWNPQDHCQLVQAFIKSGETKAAEKLQTPDDPLFASIPQQPTSFKYVSSMNIMLSGPDKISKRKVEKAISQSQAAITIKKADKFKSKRPMTASQLDRLFSKQNKEEKESFHLLISINLGELAETNELAPWLLSGQFFHFVCINSRPQEDTSKFTPTTQSKQSIFHQVLHSIGSLWSRPTKASPSYKSFAAAVVCYFGSEHTSKKNTRAVNNALKSSVENCSYCKGDMIKYCAYREKQMVFPITDKSDDYQHQLVDTISDIDRNQHWGTVMPVETQSFLKMCWKRGDILKLEDVQEIAAICGVANAKVPAILQKFFADCGAMIYFKSVPALENILICNPQILVDALNKFVVRWKSNTQVLMTGQVDSALVDYKDTSTCDQQISLEPIHVKEILKYYSFISERTIHSTAVCFMPFLLPESRLDYPSMSTFPSPFVIQFSATHSVPSGIFYALVCQLFQTWQLNNQQQYKNRIIFQIEKNILCIFSLHHHFIEVAVTGVNESTSQDLYQYIRSEVLESVNIAIELFPSVKKSEATFRFLCPHSLNSHLMPHFANVTDKDPKFLYCENPTLCTKKTEITRNIAVWMIYDTQNFWDSDLSFLYSKAKMTDECEDSETMQLVNEHIKSQGRIQLRIAKCLLFGPPNVGKTSTRKRLTGDITNLQESRPQMKSTGIDNPITVSVHHKTESSSVFIADESGQWRAQDLQAQADTFINFVLNSDQSEDIDVNNPDAVLLESSPFLDRKENQATTNISQLDVSTDTSTSIELETSITKFMSQPITNGLSFTRKNLPKKDKNTLQEIFPHWLIQENVSLSFIQKLIKAGKWKEVKMKLRNIDDTTLLQIIDTGGQPEFHEILPLLLPGPALYLLFINLTQKLNEPFPIVYTQEGGRQAEISYQSNFTYKEMLLQLLNSISCMNSTLDFTTRSIATLLGTHADQVTPETIATLEGEITQCKEVKIFLEKSLIKSIPLDGISQSIFPLNNETGEPVEIQKLQHSLSKIILKHFQPENDLPTSWFFFYLALRHKYESSPGCCTLDAAISLAVGFNIASNDVLQILEFFHNRFGTILFYPHIKSLKDLIICDPNIIFKPISHLIASSFGDNMQLDPHMLETIRQSGHVPLDLLQKFTPPDRNITAAMLVDLLKHHNIITEARGPDNTPIYFMPCLLKPDPELADITPTTILQLDPAPLVINFRKSRYVPVGFFPSLVVTLSQKWVLTDQLQHKNHITFIADSSTCAEIHLLMFADRIEIRVDCDTGKDCRKLCLEALDVVNEAIESLKDSTVYFTNCVPNFGFYCSHGLEKENNLHFANCWDINAPERMLCSKTKQCNGKRFLLLPQHKIWFPGHKYVEPETDSTPPAPPPIDFKVEVEKLLTNDQISKKILKVTAHNELYEELCPHVIPKWIPLGVLLQVDFDQIEIFKEEKKGNLDDCVNAILNHWLKRGNATRLGLVKALVSGSMGGRFYELAYRIATKPSSDDF